ncbi:VanW family protein [Arenimonas sp.]|uniref:VanW family protein n=1 Tax=Arenimonas sp. TaxID=1872635 RepID=UPI0039E46308
MAVSIEDTPRRAAPDRAPPPTRLDAWSFFLRAWGLRLLRMARDASSSQRPVRHAASRDLRDAPMLASFETSLWPTIADEDALVAGKIHNLRQALKSFDGLVIPAGAVFGFWRQLGRAIPRRGFVVGRELREGCIVPAIGGGLCQLSNGIYDTALRAGIEIVERHRHSRVLAGSLAEIDRDATVFWNYKDLRLRAPFAWRLEVAMDDSTLSIRIRAEAAVPSALLPLAVGQRAEPMPGDCTSCDATECHQHVGPRELSRHNTWLIDEDWPEFRQYRATNATTQDRSIDRVVAAGGGVSAKANRIVTAIRWRWALWRGRAIPDARLQGLQALAHSMARRLHPDDLHLIVPQGLLPFLWRDGELAGRSFDVLMTALPMGEIQRRLDRASAQHPQCTSLRDFRVDDGLLKAEADALQRARRWIGPHVGIADLAGTRAEVLPWIMPAATPKRPRAAGARFALLLPASSLARKGVFELREALRGLDVDLLLPPGSCEQPDFWQGVATRPVASVREGLGQADAVALPAWIEHQPRGLLMAMASGLPVIATPTCGLALSSSWRAVPEGDVQALRQAVSDVMGARTDRTNEREKAP